MRLLGKRIFLVVAWLFSHHPLFLLTHPSFSFFPPFSAQG